MKTQAAKGRKLLSFAAIVLAATALAIPAAEATRYLPSAPASPVVWSEAQGIRFADAFSGRRVGVYPTVAANGNLNSA